MKLLSSHGVVTNQSPSIINLPSNKMNVFQEELGRRAVAMLRDNSMRLEALHDLAAVLHFFVEVEQAQGPQPDSSDMERHQFQRDDLMLIFKLLYWLSPSCPRSSIEAEATVSLSSWSSPCCVSLLASICPLCCSISAYTLPKAEHEWSKFTMPALLADMMHSCREDCLEGCRSCSVLCTAKTQPIA